MGSSVGAGGPERQGDENASDRTLVASVLAGSSAALATLHHRYYGRLYRLAMVRCRNAEDAEDVASETFVRAIQHLGGYRFQGESIFPYLARIAANLIVDQGRKRRGVSFVSLDGGGTAGASGDAVRALLDSLPSDPATGDPHRLAERQEVRALVRAAIAGLPADQADAVLLRFGGDLPLKEIALALNKTEGAIKSLLHRALVNLRHALVEGEAEAAIFGQTATVAAAAARTAATTRSSETAKTTSTRGTGTTGTGSDRRS